MNIFDESALRNCTSCGVCASICKKNAISIQLDKEGFYRPNIDSDKCNSCGICSAICYKFDHEIKLTSIEDLSNKPLYSAWTNDADLLRHTSSGGLGDLLARQLQKDGYKVVGVIYNEDEIRAEHRIAENECDLLPFRGSKYIQSYTFPAFKEVISNCREEKYAVFGTPCQIYALNRLVTKKNVRNNFFFVDLYCHGCPSIFAWTKYEKDIKRKLEINKFDTVSFRSKAKGWGSVYIIEAKVNGETVYASKKANDKFYELFFSEQVLNMACKDCLIRSSLEYTDIRLGDFWGHKYLNNRRGVSAISLATEKGENAFEKIKESITYTRCSYDEFLPYQSWNRKYDVDAETRKTVIEILADPQKGIDDAIKELRRYQSLSSKTKRHIKTFLAFFPLGLSNGIKKILYRIK